MTMKGSCPSPYGVILQVLNKRIDAIRDPTTLFYIVLRDALTMITLIGSAHVFDISDRIEREIKERSPNVVAVELDRQRYEALRRRGEGERGKVPLIYRLLQLVQKRIAKKFGVQVGQEMITAVETAEEINSKVAFIDLPAQIVLKRLIDEMSFKEKIKLFGGAVIGLFISKERVEKEVENYYSEGDSGSSSGIFSGSIEEQMPALSRILIRDRNRFMAKNLRELEERFDSVLAVVGDGHVPGLKRELKDRYIEVVRLKEIMEGPEDAGEKKSENNNEMTFSIEYEID
ncbi:MAG: TraB/GumN family protein [Candidatus Natronoplasma sp.]